MTAGPDDEPEAEPVLNLFADPNPNPTEPYLFISRPNLNPNPNNWALG